MKKIEKASAIGAEVIFLTSQHAVKGQYIKALEHTGINVRFSHCIEEAFLECCHDRQYLILIDLEDKCGHVALEILLKEDIRTDISNVYIALISPVFSIATELTGIDIGLHGVFYQNWPVSATLKGITGILSGNLWFSRRATEIAIVKKRRAQMESMHQTSFIPAAHDTNSYGIAENTSAAVAHETDELTPKEIKVLDLISRGCTNSEIAERLFISPHTVKTHIYNLYRKTGSRNRVEAIKWASNHMVIETHWQL